MFQPLLDDDFGPERQDELPSNLPGPPISSEESASDIDRHLPQYVVILSVCHYYVSEKFVFSLHKIVGFVSSMFK